LVKRLAAAAAAAAASATNSTLDYNEYAKQLGFLMNAFAEQQKVQETEKPKSSPVVKSSKHSSDVSNGKSSKSHDDHRRSSSTSRSKPSSNSSPSVSAAPTPTPDSSMLDPLAFAAAAAAAAASSGGLGFPYFLPSGLNNTGATPNPFAGLANPTAGLYPFLSPDWFSSTSTLPNMSPDTKSSKKRAKSIRTLAEEQEKNLSTNSSLLHSALTDPNNNNGSRLSRRSSTNQSADESKSNEDDDSDPNPKRKKTDEVNETLVRIPLNLGWKRVTIVRAVTRTGVRGDVSYYAPCGRKLRSFQEIDRYLSKKNITTLDRSHFTFSSKVHIGFFHEPVEGPDGKIVFQESTEDEMVNRILKMNPKFRRIECSASPSVSNGTNDHHHQHHQHHRSEQEELAKRASEIKTKRRSTPNETPKLLESFANSQYQHTDFLKAIIEQQKLVQQQEFEHQQKLQQEQQEQERKRQELAYLKQLEMKKRQEEKMLILEQRKAEKNALREKKIQEKYMEIALAKESKRIAEDLQLKDVKPLPSLKPMENLRLSNEAFGNCLLIIEFLNKFKYILQIPDHLIPSLQTLQQALLSPSSSRDLNSLCQNLLRIALDDPGIPNPKKALTNLGQKLSEIDITEHTFSEILRIYIRERNGFDDRLTQSLSDTSFQTLIADEKAEILAFLCNDLSTNKRVVEEIDRNLDELIGLKHEKFELEKRLRRIKFEKYNNAAANGNPNMKKMANLIREKDLNSSDNESPDESDAESMRNEDETSIVNDPAAATADDQDIETLDETKIDDLDKRLTLVTRKYALIKRRVVDKQCQTRALHLGQDRYRRHYWFFSQLSGIYVEGLSSADIPADQILTTVENVTKQKLDRKPSLMPNECSTTSRSTQRKKQQNKTIVVPTATTKIPTEQSDNEEEKTTPTVAPVAEDLATMDLSAFCMAVQRDQEEKTSNGTSTSHDVEMKSEPSEIEQVTDENLPLDLSCAKPKRSSSEEEKQSSQIFQPKTEEKLHELNASILFNNVKQETKFVSKNLLDFTPSYFQNLLTNPILASLNLPPTITPQEFPMINFKEIDENAREKFQYADPIPIPDDVQSGWWIIQTSDELRQLIKSLVKRGQRERFLCRSLQRYFDVLTNSMKISNLNLDAGASPSSMENQESETGHDDHQSSFNDISENEPTNFDDTHEMDVLNEIYNLSDRITASSLQCRSYDINATRKRLTYADIQAKGSEVLDEAKQLLTDLERNIERRYLKHPFVRKSEINLTSLNRINQHGTYHHTQENSTNEIVSSSKYDEVPQQLERWRRTVLECRTAAQLALCLTQLERCIAWEKSIMRVYCEICNSDVDEEKLLLCDGCDHGTHTYCFNPPMSFIPPNDWYCYVCIGKAKGENLCFVCGNKGDQPLNKCEHCSKLFHEECLKNARQQRGKWLCVLCATNDNSTMLSSLNATQSNGKWVNRSSTFRSTNNSPCVSKTRPPATPTNNRKSKSRPSSSHQTDPTILQETHSNSSHAETTNLSNAPDASPLTNVDLDDDLPSPTIGAAGSTSNGKKKTTRKSKTNQNESEDIKACRVILNELLKHETSWPFQTPVDAKQHPEYYDCIKHPMDFATMKKKMRNHQYHNREEFFQDVELILNNCRYYNEDDSPVGEAGHALREFFEARWTKQFG